MVVFLTISYSQLYDGYYRINDIRWTYCRILWRLKNVQKGIISNVAGEAIPYSSEYG